MNDHGDEKPRLRTVLRLIATSALATAPRCRRAGWAAEVFRRHGEADDAWPTLERVLATSPVSEAPREPRAPRRFGPILAVFHRHRHDWRLSVVIRGDVSNTIDSRDTTTLIHRSEGDLGTRPATSSLVERLRTRDVETIRTVFPPVTRVLVAASRPPVAAAPGVAGAENATPPSMSETRSPWPSSAPAWPASNGATGASTPGGFRYWTGGGSGAGPEVPVEKLTDQVIHAIDRRVTAARERLGKR